MYSTHVDGRKKEDELYSAVNCDSVEQEQEEVIKWYGIK